MNRNDKIKRYENLITEIYLEFIDTNFINKMQEKIAKYGTSSHITKALVALQIIKKSETNKRAYVWALSVEPDSDLARRVVNKTAEIAKNYIENKNKNKEKPKSNSIEKPEEHKLIPVTVLKEEIKTQIQNETERIFMTAGLISRRVFNIEFFNMGDHERKELIKLLTELVEK